MNDKSIMKDDKPHKIAQVIMLPTKNELWKVNDEHADRFEFLFYDIKKKILYSRNSNALNWSISHLYIISDEEIKEGDWYYNSSSKTIHQSNGIEIFDYRKDKQVNWKIIASTNSELKEENVLCNDIPLPRPSDDFLKDFVKAQGKVFDKVLVEYIKLEEPTDDGNSKKYIQYDLKIAPDNTITIKPVEKEKKDYGIEYLKFIATRFAHECRLKGVVSNHETCTLFDKWIKENL